MENVTSFTLLPAIKEYITGTDLTQSSTVRVKSGSALTPADGQHEAGEGGGEGAKPPHVAEEQVCVSLTLMSSSQTLKLCLC